MVSFKKFEEIESWKYARKLNKEVFALLKKSKLLKNEFALKSQITKCSISIMANIAEGFSRKTDKEFAQFLHISKGSCSELKSHFYVLLDIEAISIDIFEKLYNDTSSIEKLLSGLITYLKKRS
jgi:four helix bundle protein